jgi:hypothetical protein
VPRKASELGACKDLEDHIFAISSGNKGKDGDMLCTSKENMATYFRTKYGNNAAQEWTSKKRLVLMLEPSWQGRYVSYPYHRSCYTRVLNLIR